MAQPLASGATVKVEVVGTSSGGSVTATGAAADGAAVSGNPVLVAGQDGTNAQSLLTDSTGRQVVVGAAADGAAVAGNPVLMAGQDGTLAQSLLTDSTGRQVVVGAAADGAAVAGNPVLVCGQDGTNAQSLLTDATGKLVVDIGGGNAAADGATVASFVGPTNASGTQRPGLSVLPHVHNGTTADIARAVRAASNGAGTGVAAAGIMGWDGTAVQQASCDTSGTLRHTQWRTMLTATPVLTVAGAYTAGDAFGAKISVASAARISGGLIVIEGITAHDKTDSANAFDLWIFGDDPSATTVTDNSAVTIDEAADLAKLLSGGIVRVVAGDWVDLGACRYAQIGRHTKTSIENPLPLTVKLAATTLYIVCIAQHTASYADGDISFRLKITSD